MKRIYETMKLNPAPMTGKELFTVLYGSKYNLDFQNQIGDMNHLADEILKRYEEKEKRISGMCGFYSSVIVSCNAGVLHSLCNESLLLTDRMERNFQITEIYRTGEL